MEIQITPQVFGVISASEQAAYRAETEAIGRALRPGNCPCGGSCWTCIYRRRELSHRLYVQRTGSPRCNGLVEQPLFQRPSCRLAATEWVGGTSYCNYHAAIARDCMW